MIGIQNFFRQAAALTLSSATPVNTDLVFPLAALQTVSGNIRLFFSVGATGGIRAIFTAPVGITNYAASFLLANTVAPATVLAQQVTTPAAFANALANAGNHYINIAFSFTNGATAGNVVLQMGQNTTDALTASLLAGSFAEVIYS